MAKRIITDEQIQYVITAYTVNKTSMSALAFELDVSQETIKYHLQHNNVTIRSVAEATELYNSSVHGSPAQRYKHQQSKKKEYRAKRLNKIIEWLRNHLLNHPCTDCGNTNIIVLEFDHRDPKDKTADISFLKKKSLNKVKLEIEKCDVVCRNCHAIRTANMFGSWRLK